MSNKELKPCPFCGTKARLTEQQGLSEVWCVTCGVTTGLCPYDHAIKRWNTRPVEDALKAELEELRYIVGQFAQWYNENGCPKKHNPDFLCSAEKEYKDDPETDGDFNERDCWKEEHEHGCWVEYYRWKYRKARGEE